MNPKFQDLVVTHWGARFMGYTLPVAIGRSGIAEKVGEGDGITPIGKFSIKDIGFRNDRIFFNSPNIEKKTYSNYYSNPKKTHAKSNLTEYQLELFQDICNEIFNKIYPDEYYNRVSEQIFSRIYV